MTTNFASGSLHLTQAIEQVLGHPLSKPIQCAFLSINRLAFVPSYYAKDGYQWREQPAGPEVYENQFFWTHLDQRGIPDSSSSQPSLMAAMLEALDLKVGQRVLEIGTGTGYNAALMGAIVGATGQVISIDVTPDLVQRAAERFDDQPWVQTIAADGLHGYPIYAPYDRIIITGSSPTIPSAWIEQLSVDGLLVGSLSNRLSTSTPLYRLVKQNDGIASGSFLSSPAFFMALHQQSQAAPITIDTAAYDSEPVIEDERTAMNVPQLLRHPSYALFLELHLPGLQASLWMPKPVGTGLHTPGICLVLPQQAIMTCLPDASKDSWHIVVKGRVPLWSRFLEAYQCWEQQGKPPLSSYRLEVDTKGEVVIALVRAEQ